MSRERARAATERAELAAEAGDHRTAAALRAAAQAWERLARPGVAWSLEPVRQQLQQLKRELAVSTGPFQPPAPPKPPAPRAARPDPTPQAIEQVLHDRIAF